MGGKGKLMWLINKLSPIGYDRFVDVFGGSATVTLNRPLKKGCLEVYNDYNSNNNLAAEVPRSIINSKYTSSVIPLSF